VGLPAPGIELKLLVVDGKTEVRYRGPNVTPGYWRAPQGQRPRPSTKKVSSRTGDAVKWIDDADIHLGLQASTAA
jgi:feruloyl-CoA synthase